MTSPDHTPAAASQSDPDTVEGCVFCGIVQGEIPARIVYEDELAMAFADLEPKAPVHVLVIPKAHVADLGELSTKPDLSSALLGAIAATGAALGLASYRTIFNTGAEAGQTVFHAHAHLLGGGGRLPGFDKS